MLLHGEQKYAKLQCILFIYIYVWEYPKKHDSDIKFMIGIVWAERMEEI